MDPKVKWEMEGELLTLSLRCDKLRAKKDLTDEEREALTQAEKRKTILEAKLREGRLDV